MRKPLLISVLMGLLAFGAAQAFARTATVVMRSGDTFTGVLEQEAPAWAQGRRDDRGDRRDSDNARPSEYERRSSAPRGARTVVVPSNVAWTNTRIQVARGQWLRFEPSGEIRLSFNGEDVATAAGAKSFRFAQSAPIPTIPVGALIGRVNNGKPFSIGDTTQAFQMPANGTLFLGVNDDHVPDNSGNYVVKVWEP